MVTAILRRPAGGIVPFPAIPSPLSLDLLLSLLFVWPVSQTQCIVGKTVLSPEWQGEESYG